MTMEKYEEAVRDYEKAQTKDPGTSVWRASSELARKWRN
jgi:hypothetical protein